MSADSILDHIVSLLMRLRVFPDADADLIRELASICSFMSVPGGAEVVRKGEESDAVYLIVTGIFGAYAQAGDCQEILLNRMGVGEIIGEVGFITGEPRSATVKALRNSELLRIDKADLNVVVSHRPSLLFAICGTLVRRLQNAQSSQKVPARPRSFCVVPSDPSINASATALQLVDALEAFGNAAVVTRGQTVEHTSDWFAELEERFDFIVFLGDAAPTPWTRFCLRQCDCILLLAQGEAAPIEFAALGPDRAYATKGIPIDLLLLWKERVVPGKTAPWLDAVKPRAHHHVRSKADAGRAARLAAGHGLGLILGGGGARGLAHVGVIAALRDSGIPVDVVGGTSIGGLIGSGIALEWNLEEIVIAFVKEFARSRLTDYAIPRVAMFSERKFDRTMGRWFGELCIEDAPIRFFCLSSNLTNGCPEVHARGRFNTWIRATTAIPGVFPPILEDNSVHVDGGLFNNLPAKFAGEFGVSTVVAVDVGSDAGGPWRYGVEREVKPGAKPPLPSMFELLYRVGTVGGGAAEEAARRDSNVFLRPNLDGIGIFGWALHRQAIDAGHRVVIENLPKIKASLGGTFA
jgi:NTE family protein